MTVSRLEAEAKDLRCGFGQRVDRRGDVRMHHYLNLQHAFSISVPYSCVCPDVASGRVWPSVRRSDPLTGPHLYI